MKLNFKGLALAALLVTSAQPALATTYDFRYQFNAATLSYSNYGGPYIVTGSFDGTDDGVYVTGITNLSVALDGVAFTRPLRIMGGNVDPLAVSFVLGNNHFFIDDWRQVGDLFVVDSAFFLAARPGHKQRDYASTGPMTVSGFYRATLEEAQAPGAPDGDWSLTARPTTPVPEPSTFALFALGAAGIAAARRRRRIN